MQSYIDTVTLPLRAPGAAVRFVVGHETLPMRVVIRNVGGVTALLAYDSSPLSGSASTGTLGKTFSLPAGAELVIIMQPKQNLWGISSGAATAVSYHASVALPLGGL